MSGTPISPKKSLSVREDQDGAKTLHVKKDTDRYKSISDFYFTIKAFVRFPEKDLTHLNGYIVVVHRRDGVTM